MSLNEEMKACEAQIDAEQTIIDQFESMVAHPGWKTLCTIMQEQTRLRRNEVLTKDAVGFDGCIEREKDIAELRGLNTAMQMPHIMMEEGKLNVLGLRQQIEELQEEQAAESEV